MRFTGFDFSQHFGHNYSKELSCDRITLVAIRVKTACRIPGDLTVDSAAHYLRVILFDFGYNMRVDYSPKNLLPVLKRMPQNASLKLYV